MPFSVSVSVGVSTNPRNKKRSRIAPFLSLKIQFMHFMKKILLAFFLLYNHVCHAQVNEVDFINEVTQIETTLSGIDSLLGYHYLVEFTIKIDTASAIWGIKHMKKGMPYNIKQELREKIIENTPNEKWDCKSLTKTKCIIDSSVVPEGHPYYIFSKPIFDRSYKYALMQVNRGYAKSPIGGYAILLFNKKNEKWHFLENIADSEY
jgi:hypothetical protein